MKINKLKRTQANLTFYKNNFGFHPPYKILVDRTFCNLCIKLGFDLNVQLTKYLQSDVMLFTTRCVIKEMEKIGESVKEALKTIKTLRIAKCVQSELDVRPAKCFLAIVSHESNAEHFFIASQDVKLLAKLNLRIACPFICIKLNALFLNKPTAASKEQAKSNVEHALDYEMSKLKEIKKIELGEEEDANSSKRRRKKVKGPHPLSCRKKQPKVSNVETQTSSDQSASGKKRRKQKKNKISKHIRRLLKKNNEDV